MSTSVVRPFNTLDHHSVKNPGRRKCRCCPYGYHIDLDFVRYCETIASSQLLSDLPIRRSRWNIRKRRASKETLLGIAALTQLEEDTTKASEDVGDDLQKAVRDFEQVLSSSSYGKSRSLTKSRDWKDNKIVIGSDDVTRKYKTIGPITFKDELKFYTNAINEDFENNAMNSKNNTSPQLLQTIRKQMATSLGRMRELEEEVKLIPDLQARISNLKKENTQLNNIIKEEENLKKCRKTNLVDVSTITSPINHTRNIGVGCTVMTRDIGICGIVNMVSCGTDPQIIKQSFNDDKSSIVRPCLVSLENIIGTPSKPQLKNAATITDSLNKVTKDAVTETELKLKKVLTESDLNKKILIMTEDFEKKMKKSVTNIGVLTDLRRNQIFTKQDIDILTANNEKQKFEKYIPTVNVASQTCHHGTREIITQTNPINHSDIGISVKVQMLDKWVQMIKSTKHVAVSNHTINDPCFRCNIKKCHAGVQCEESVKPKQIKLSENQSKQTDTVDLTLFKDQCVNTSKKKLVSTGVGTITEKISEIQQSSTNAQNILSRPSYLPVPIQSFNKSIIKSTTQSTERLRNEDYASDSASDDGTNTNNDAVLQRTECHSFHPIQSKSYKKEPSKEMKGALKVLNDSLKKYSSDNFPKHMRNAVNIVQQEWFKVSSIADALPHDVEDYLDCFEEISSSLLECIVNMTDVTGNTAMHYAVSNGNFDVVSILLDSKVCNINKVNTAGYTCIMLVALTKARSETDRQVVRRLFQMADVNIRAKQHGQTALMLAVSHGRIDTVELLLESGADINIQDEDGSTALMCAAEHGYIDIVKLLLTQPDCDLSITDYDGSTALSIAMEAGNRDIGVLLYAQEHFSRGNSPFTQAKFHRRAKSATPTLRSASSLPTYQGEISH